MDFPTIQLVLARAGVQFTDRLTNAEFARIEREFGFQFPPGLREFLSIGLPVSDDWVNWRELDSKEIRDWLCWPLRGICFDIEKNLFWLDEWGPQPPNIEEAFEIARRAVADAPVLIPVFGHRFLPATPREAGNPVFSVYQTDIIYYGADLTEYFQNEFSREYQITGEPRRIDFWTKLVELNGGATRPAAQP